MIEPWSGDACSLVEAVPRRPAFAGRRARRDAGRDRTLGAQRLLVRRRRRRAPVAADADVSHRSAACPLGVKELTDVEGWPKTEASVVLRDHVASRDSTMVTRLRAAGAVPVGLTTASEFGGISLTYTKLNGATREPVGPRTHAGRIVGRFGGRGRGRPRDARHRRRRWRIDPHPRRVHRPARTQDDVRPDPDAVPISSSVRSPPRVDASRARCATSRAGSTSRNGFDPHDPTSLPRVDGWEAGLGTQDLRGMRVAVSRDLGVALVDDETADRAVRSRRITDRAARSASASTCR